MNDPRMALRKDLMMLCFDHMTMIAPSLEEGVEHLADRLGIELVNGATHRDMATHNRRIKLGDDCYLEVIAIDPKAPTPGRPRWFGLDQVDQVREAWSQGRRLRGWVARTDDIDAVIGTHRHILGSKRWLDQHFYFSVPEDGRLPLSGVAPSVIDTRGAPPTAESLTDQGLRLTRYILEHPLPHEVEALYRELGVARAPTVVFGDEIRYVAEIRTPMGSVMLS